MKILNRYNLPPGFVNIVERGQHPPKKDRFSTTDIIGPPLIRTLKMEKWDEIETDVADYLWMILGIATDNLISSSDDKQSIRQRKIVYPIGDKNIVGKIDVINGDTLADYKCTSVNSAFYPVKDEWIEQLNVYDFLYRWDTGNGGITNLKIHAIYRDWMVRKSLEAGYPDIAFETIPVPKWTKQEQEDYIQARLADHCDNPYRLCTDEEMWTSQTTFAVKKKGMKRALRVLNTEEDAKIWMMKNKKGDYVETRKGERRRCKAYCGVRSVCPFKGDV
jgi:hypothetical protein